MTPVAAQASLRRLLNIAGEDIHIRRYTGAGADRPFFEAKTRARIVSFEPQEIAGPVQEGDRNAIVMVEDLVARKFPLPVVRGDKLVLGGGKILNIEGVDDRKRKIGAVLIAYELRVRG